MSTVCLLSLILAAQPAASVVALNDDVQTGRLAGVSTEEVRLQTDAGEELTLPSGDLRAVQFPDVEPPSPFADPPAITVVLADGSQLAATAFTTQGDKVRLDCEDLGELQLPLRAVRGVRFGSADKVADRWQELLQRENRSDLFVRRKQDVLDFVEGSVGDVGPQELSFLLTDQTVAIPRDRVFGLIYASSAGAAPRPAAEVRIGRNRLQVRDLATADSVCRLTLASGSTITAPLDRIHLIEFASRVRRLGDLEPVLVLPDGAAPEERFRYFRRDTEPFGGPLRIGSDEVIARDGLWIHSGVTARYRINRDYRRLAAIVGMDHNVGGNRSVRLVIRGDGRDLFNEVIAYAHAARRLDLDVAGVRDLEIRVERLPESLTDNLFAVQEHLDLGQIRLIR